MFVTNGRPNPWMNRTETWQDVAGAHWDELGLTLGSKDPGTHRKRPKKLAVEGWGNH